MRSSKMLLLIKLRFYVGSTLTRSHVPKQPLKVVDENLRGSSKLFAPAI